MAESTILEWLEENSYRAYPLQEGYATKFIYGKMALPFDLYNVVVDANLAYYSLPAAVYLEKIIIAGSTLTIYVTPAVGSPDNNTFVYTLNAGTHIYYGRNASGDLLVLNDNINQLIGYNTYFNFNVPFEPSVCCEIGGAYVGVTSIAINGTDISADTLVNGYQLAVLPTGQNIDLEVGRNYGQVLPCYNRFSPPSLTCGQIVNNINGATPTATGGSINIVAGQHVQIYNDPDSHTVYIGLDFVSSDISFGQLTPTP